MFDAAGFINVCNREPGKGWYIEIGCCGEEQVGEDEG